ncbi:hypothetical protein ACFQI7_10480 [Paenibacillus allorhizosphaerae]|uniref:Uncharacterized protein n=1 Tax=Paenibacillus allorhizosphaerae TaxID=2849866 RepID=A0ABM8VHY2_9BACL|nr:hypothetical protein [Paenibacillus allorhizosphaerae]CAG7643309.1 hypothetical protein PAECIP111802_02991 [Paenibacillus allorhizosphaerae]
MRKEMFNQSLKILTEDKDMKKMFKDLQQMHKELEALVKQSESLKKKINTFS